jgi:hypothetical protein
VQPMSSDFNLHIMIVKSLTLLRYQNKELYKELKVLPDITWQTQLKSQFGKIQYINTYENLLQAKIL